MSQLKIEFNYGSNNIQLDLMASRTVIESESATGRTFIYKALQAAQRYALRGDRLQRQDTAWEKNFLFINSLSIPREILFVCASSCQVIVIDNANYLINKFSKLRDKLNNFADGNKYLIFGRSPLGIKSQNVYYCELRYENQKFTLV